MNFLLGCNYWGSECATDMWKLYDPQSIRADLHQLAQTGVRCMRVFPNWRDFQPVQKMYAWQGTFGEYIHADTGESLHGDGVSEQQLDHFLDFAAAAQTENIQLVVSIVTGWMSGRLFAPPVLEGKNLISDPEALMWMGRYVRHFVRAVKACPNVVMWDLGNECNCLGRAATRAEAYTWTQTVCDAIRSEDRSRPISSGMHTLEAMPDGVWTIRDQGELTDYLTPHPYPSPTVGADVEPLNRLRTTLVPTAQALYYSGLSGRPAIIQESGTFSGTIGSEKMSADFVRVNVLSALANNIDGYLWWCAWDQTHLMKPPYSWSMIERELGLFNSKKEPKSVAQEMLRCAQLVEQLPQGLPKRQTDAVCVLTRGQKQQQIALASCILGKQAGLEMIFAPCDEVLPDAKLYLMPAISGWQVTYRATWDFLQKKVREDGAALYVSYAGGQLTEFSEVFGVESCGCLQDGKTHQALLPSGAVPFTGKRLLLQPKTAEVLAVDEEGYPVWLRNHYGRGTVDFLNFSPEQMAWEQGDAFRDMAYDGVYGALAEQLPAKSARSRCRAVGLTIHPESENSCMVMAVNYSDQPQRPELELAPGWKIEKVLYGNPTELSPCDGCILKLHSAKDR